MMPTLTGMSAFAGGPTSRSGHAGIGDWRRILTALLWTAVILCLLLSLASFIIWRRDLAEIRGIVEPEIGEPASRMELIYETRDFLRDHVGYGRHGSYFLSPIFSFMRPTALQVIREGGDCAYRTRAFIVILDLYDVRARKLALYDGRGRPVHAVAEIPTENGRYYVDLLYNIVHQDAAGRPLSLAELSRESVLRGSIERAVAAGNARAQGYPLHLYDFRDVRTLNWEKNALTKAAYRILALTLGEERARRVPRPHLSEEPALMVITLAMGGSGCLLVIIFVLGRSHGRRRAATAPIASAARDARSAVH